MKNLFFLSVLFLLGTQLNAQTRLSGVLKIKKGVTTNQHYQMEVEPYYDEGMEYFLVVGENEYQLFKIKPEEDPRYKNPMQQVQMPMNWREDFYIDDLGLEEGELLEFEGQVYADGRITVIYQAKLVTTVSNKE